MRRRTGRTAKLRLGFDTQERLLETVVLTFASSDETLLRHATPRHATPARKHYWDLLP